MKKVFNSGFLTLGIVLLLFFLATTAAQAQCPMCRMSAESNLANGGVNGRGLNTGILYMLAMPYLVVGAIGYWWWRNRRPESGQQAAEMEGPGGLD